jgi:hypothetical protein
MNRNTKLLLWVIGFLIVGCSERLTVYYPKYEDAVKDGAIKRGWIPGLVPATATEIHEQHTLDTDDVWVRFAIPTSEKNRLTAGLKRLSDTEIQKVKVRWPSRTNWWFEGLIQQSPANDNALYAEIYIVQCREKKLGYIAFDLSSQSVFYWCTR